MIKVEVNRGNVHIEEAEGDAYTLMAELCYVVRAVLRGWCEDEEESEKLMKQMMCTVAVTLITAEGITRGADLEDDENADF